MAVCSTTAARPSPASWRGAEVADDGGVGEQEQRLGDQGQEGGNGEPEDLPVACVPHRTSLVMVSSTLRIHSLPD